MTTDQYLEREGHDIVRTIRVLKIVSGLTLALLALISAFGCHLHLHVNEKHYHGSEQDPEPDIVLEIPADG